MAFAAAFDTTEYGAAFILVNKYIAARNGDLLPDVATEETLGMTGERGRLLYGAMKTLYLQGRFSRTMLESALCYSPTSYSEYIPFFLSSLPPKARSRYAAELYNNNYKGLVWDSRLYSSLHKGIVAATGADPPKPLMPIGDNRHEPKMACIARYAANFHTMLNAGILFESSFGLGEGEETDVLHRKLDPEYVDMLAGDDFLAVVGPCFGIDKDDLNYEQESTHRIDTMSPSEVMLRTWNLMYHCERLCKTELECALLQGPEDGVKALFSTGIKLLSMFSAGWPAHMNSESIRSLLGRAESLDLNNDVDFATCPTPHDSDAMETFMECDYCGETPPKKLNCSRCHIAMYCSRDCQKGDWKRHKRLCSHYQEL